MTTQELARKTLDRLEEVGWSERGSHGPHGEECVAVAAVSYCGHRINAPHLCRQLYEAIRDRVCPEALPVSPGTHVALWNDNPETTWEDVKRVLTEIAES